MGEASNTDIMTIKNMKYTAHHTACVQLDARLNNDDDNDNLFPDYDDKNPNNYH